MPAKSDDTTIKLSRTTKTRLDKIGLRGETYDQIVNKSLDVYDKFWMHVKK